MTKELREQLDQIIAEERAEAIAETRAEVRAEVRAETRAEDTRNTVQRMLSNHFTDNQILIAAGISESELNAFKAVLR
ncbi:MAG: hypothetical protein ACI32N_03485 [Bulleidia sp.]